jgi:hypothetical protein
MLIQVLDDLVCGLDSHFLINAHKHEVIQQPSEVVQQQGKLLGATATAVIATCSSGAFCTCMTKHKELEVIAVILHKKTR